MAWRAGCRIANLEFMQFHPTCLYSAEKVSGLITEAVRGEGGVLLLPDGTRFMRGYDERGDLAPRDIVSRAIVSEMRRLGIDHVLLDISHEPAEIIRERFPNVLRFCAANGYDLTAEPIPVVPAAHYTCGGIVVDARGQTDLQHLYALGECSFTGLHGANRLASNSLLEALAFADTISRNIEKSLGVARYDTQALPVAAAFSAKTSAISLDQIAEWTKLLRRLMWRYVGIVRTRDGLALATSEINALETDLERAMGRDPHSIAALELRNMLTVAKLVTQSAQQRHESRGLHFNTDYPQPGVDPRDSSIQLGFAGST
jgi:L-aspartate oxidase